MRRLRARTPQNAATDASACPPARRPQGQGGSVPIPRSPTATHNQSHPRKAAPDPNFNNDLNVASESNRQALPPSTGECDGDRTRYTLIRSQVLYRLSYTVVLRVADASDRKQP